MMHLKYALIGCLLLINGLHGITQELTHARGYINALSSEKMMGRGYVKHGDKKAAKYIRSELKTMGIQAFSHSYFQQFSFAMNTFPGNMEVQLDKQSLRPVYDFVIAPESKSCRGTFPLVFLPAAADTNHTLYQHICQQDYSGKFIVADFPTRKGFEKELPSAAGIIIPKKNIYWWASSGHYEANTPLLHINDSLLKGKPETLTVNFKNKFKTNYTSQNVIGFIKGSVNPDSLLVFSAHYDHLGCMGKKNIFRGANDNASGVAMVLELARHFSKTENKPGYSMAFIFFAAEECGLLGSLYFVENPTLPLTSIKTLINLDMVGTGSDGIAIVNGKSNEAICHKIKDINNKHSYFSSIQIRGEACNSDHCFFHKAGVPSVFIYTKGEEFSEYHNLNDTPKKLPLTKFKELLLLLIEFTAQQ